MTKLKVEKEIKQGIHFSCATYKRPNMKLFLCSYLREWMASTGRGLPEFFGRCEVEDAAQMFLSLIEPPYPGETPRKLPSGRWIDPYMDRVKNYLGKFLAVSLKDQRRIRDIAYDGFHWRGDDMLFFEQAYSEYRRIKAEGFNGAKANVRRIIYALVQKFRGVAN